MKGNRLLFVLIALFVHFSSDLHAQLKRPFTPRFSVTAKGAMTFVSNNIITSTNVVPAGYGYTAPASPPAVNDPLPGTASGDPAKNDKYLGAHIDIDSDPTTPNSSSANLSLPPCNAIAFAGLYWGAGAAINQGAGQAATGPTPMDSVTNWNKVKLKVPGATAYTTLTASVMDTVTTTFHGYQGFADVTALVRASGVGTYTVADVKCPVGKVNTYGGWTIVVVYEDSTQPLKNFTVYDGNAVINSGSGNLVDFAISGFYAPPTGSVGAQIGVVAYDGDRSALDKFFITDTSGTRVDQTTAPEAAAASSKANDTWNSSITSNGLNVATRNPAHSNTMGYDADLFLLYNANKRYLRNNSTTLQARISSDNEGYVLGMVAMQIDNFQPKLLLEDSIANLNGTVLKPADTVVFTSFVRNTGNDSALNVVFKDTLVPALKYVPNSIVVNGVPKTDAAGDDIAQYDAASRAITVNLGTGAVSNNGGTIKLQAGDTARISYRVTVSTNCAETGAPSDVFYHKSILAYKGQTSGMPQSAVSRNRPGAGGCAKPAGARPLSVQSSCVPLPLRLLYFSGTLQHNQSVGLYWEVAEDPEGDRYELYRSQDGRLFDRIYTRSAGDANNVITYQYTDNPEWNNATTLLYQLKLIHKDGTSQSSAVVPVRITKNTEAPQLYPNPASESITLRHLANPEQSLVRIRIFDMRGQEVKQIATGEAMQKISLQGLPEGVYFLSYQTADAHYRLPFVKQ